MLNELITPLITGICFVATTAIVMWILSYYTDTDTTSTNHLDEHDPNYDPTKQA